MKESDETRMMRAMAWCRAKGELSSMLETYVQNDNFEPFQTLLKAFIKTVEDSALQE
jgi:hypothetical protein